MSRDVARLDALLSGFSVDYSTWVELGHEIGPAALACVLDKLGGGKWHVPTLEALTAELEREARNEVMRLRYHPVDCDYKALGNEYDKSPRQVRRIIHGPRPGKSDTDRTT